MNDSQASRRVSIPNPQGLHARPSTALMKLATKFESSIRIVNHANGAEADAKYLLEIMTLGAAQGAELEIAAEGADAEAAVTAIGDLVASGFGES